MVKCKDSEKSKDQEPAIKRTRTSTSFRKARDHDILSASASTAMSQITTIVVKQNGCFERKHEHRDHHSVDSNLEAPPSLEPVEDGHTAPELADSVTTSMAIGDEAQHSGSMQQSNNTQVWDLQSLLLDSQLSLNAFRQSLNSGFCYAMPHLTRSCDMTGLAMLWKICCALCARKAMGFSSAKTALAVAGYGVNPA